MISGQIIPILERKLGRHRWSALCPAPSVTLQWRTDGQHNTDGRQTESQQMWMNRQDRTNSPHTSKYKQIYQIYPYISTQQHRRPQHPYTWTVKYPRPHKHNIGTNPDTLLSIFKGNAKTWWLCVMRSLLTLQWKHRPNLRTTVAALSASLKHYLILHMFKTALRPGDIRLIWWDVWL